MDIEVFWKVVLKVFEVLLGWRMGQARDLKAFPKPLACASGESTKGINLIETDGQFELNYDFNMFNPAEEGSFVSWYYNFSEPVSLVHFWGLKFLLINSGEHINKIDIEIKGVAQNTLPILASKSFSLNQVDENTGPKDKDKNGDNQQIMLEWVFDRHDKINLKNVKQICFVIKPPYCTNGTSAKGKIEIKGLVARKKILRNRFIDYT